MEPSQTVLASAAEIGPYPMDSTGPDVSGVHSGTGRPLVELHHLFSLLKEPEEGRDAADIEDVGSDAHQVVQDASHLREKN